MLGGAVGCRRQRVLSLPCRLQAPKAPKEPVDLKQLNVRKYLEATVVSVLLKGMQELAKKRPQDPLDYLADYLKENNPAKKAKTEA